MWFAYVEDATGLLVSIGTIDQPSLPAGIVQIAANVPDPLEPKWVWDTATRSFINRPAKVLIDRWQDLLTSASYSDFQTVYNALNATRKQQIQAVLLRLLGTQRWRSASEGTEL